ncbi:metal ABC transporter substrate-binding protein [Cellulomonas sp.]|uniref:metal ABC transporter substrate-binding protein n=1 Tax=Cellulomonas sp. TaxID=40001 RepID=UPI001B18032C|nr:metal ABC transporter substrate-binding protein [Cellulomonas sp.]MBO9555239.1 zinc ABC transporter substrate-binding protein [Cellulomonas sp.]
MFTSGRRALLRLAPLAVLPVVLTGCAQSAGSDDDTVHVLASFYPLQMIAEQVGGDRVTVDSLTPPGAEPHDVELSPAQVSRIDRADLVVYLSGFQAAVDEAIEQTSPERVVDVADVEDLLTLEQEGTESHADEIDHADEDSHDHGALDPHFWLDPSRMPAAVDAVTDALSQADPENTDEYRANADALNARFDDLDQRYTEGLASCDTRTFVTSHEAFGYLAHRYDLHQVGISGLDPDAEPSPKRLAAVEDIVREEGVTTIFFEQLVSPKVARTLAADLGIDAAVLDPIEGVTGDADYFSIADDNLAALRVALSCS